MQKNCLNIISTSNLYTKPFSFFFTDIECPEFDISDVELESRMDGRKIGAQVHFTCPRGFNLKGLNRLICQRNGNFIPHTCTWAWGIILGGRGAESSISIIPPCKPYSWTVQWCVSIVLRVRGGSISRDSINSFARETLISSHVHMLQEPGYW